MKAWSYDASELKPQDITEAYIFKNLTIEDYLNAGSHERKLFLIGPKGSGKTLLLRYKAYKYWQKLEADEVKTYQTSESNELVESLEFKIRTLSEKELIKLSNHHAWSEIWAFAISLIILRRCKIRLPEKYEKKINNLFPSHFGLSEIITELIIESSTFIFSDFFNCINSLVSKLKEIRSTFALFIDRVDQALEKVSKNHEYDYLENKHGKDIAFLVWRNAQFSLLETIYNLNTATNSHLKIFATARIEALEIESELTQNIRHYCTELFYTKEELKEIFANNIKLTPKKDLVYSGNKDPFLSFFGFDSMAHLIALDQNKIPIIENVFDFICRHSFERPREIITIGRYIYDELISKESYKTETETNKIENIRRVVNHASHHVILKGYLFEIIPSFKDDYLDEFSKTIKQNVIPRAELLQIDQKIVNYLYRVGLIGFLRSQKQEFLPASRFIYDTNEKIPNVDFYFVHPAIDRRLQQIQNYNEFYTKYNIIGNGYKFTPPNLFKKTNWSDKKLEKFIPIKVAGKGDSLNTENKNWAIHVPLIKLYEEFFINNQSEELSLFKENKFDEAARFLSCIADLYFCSEIKTKFNSNPNLDIWEKNLRESLASFEAKNNFLTQIKSIETTDLINFGRRLTGRIITVGLHVFLQLNHNQIQHILKNFEFTLNTKIDEENSLKYIRNSFFISGLKQTPPGNSDQKSDILNMLSPFEKEFLENWWARYRNHELLPNIYLTEEHLSHLNDKLFNV